MSHIVTEFIEDNAVTNEKLADMPALRIKGNNTGSLADPKDLTGTEVTAMLDPMVGDTGTGGLKGLAPAPAAGDAAAGRFLKADGTWSTTPDELVKVTSDDTTPGYLNDKLTGGTAVSLVEVNGGGDEDLRIDVADMVGDAGAGGTAGLAPAPAAGDAAADKFLKADGTWSTTPGGGGGSPAGVNRDIQLNNSGAFGVATPGTFKATNNAGFGNGTIGGSATTLTKPPYYSQPNGAGAILSGRVNSAYVNSYYAYFNADGVGAVARGSINAKETVGTGYATIKSTGRGAVATGYVEVIDTAGTSFNAQMKSEGNGSIVAGRMNGRYGVMAAYSDGAMAIGRLGGGNSNTYLISQGEGAIAAGRAGDIALLSYGRIEASAAGAIATGVSEDSYNGIRAQGIGSLAQGVQTGGNYTIRAQADGTMARGFSGSQGNIVASANAAIAHGNALYGNIYGSGVGAFAGGQTNYGTINASGVASVAFGAVANNSYLLATSLGSRAGGYANGGGTLQANAVGSLVHGVINNGAGLHTTGVGAVAMGYAYSGGGIYATNRGAVAMGHTDGGVIQASGYGAVAMGRGYGSGAIQATGHGSVAMGQNVFSSGVASIAMGYSGGGALSATADGAFAFGYVSSSGLTRATNKGSFAGGFSTGTAIEADGYGSMAFGYSGSVIDTGNYKGCLAFGDGNTGPIYCMADGAVQFHNGTNDNYASLAVGPNIRLGSHYPNNKRVGDIWYGGSHVYMHTSGYDWKGTYQCARRSQITTGVSNSGSFTNFTIEYGLITSAS
jgi:hypothetical protein